jgi:hypothetical protein
MVVVQLEIVLQSDRMCERREVVPSAGIVDSQSVKAPGARERGQDARKKISGRKRQFAVDTDGRVLAVNLTPADIADSTVAQLVLDALLKRWPRVKHLFGNTAYPVHPAGQGRLSRLDRRSCAWIAGTGRLSGTVTTLGRRAQVCMAAALAPSCPRL